jgi:hypothetical protein
MKSSAVFGLALVGLAAATLVADNAPFVISPPAVIVDVDGHSMKGDPVELSWSPTPGQFYVETADGTAPDVTLRHYLVALGDKSPSGVKAQPTWAQQYWAYKSRRDAPADTSLLIDVRNTTEDNIPTQSLANKARATESGGGGAFLSGAQEAAHSQETAAEVRTLVLKGTDIGKFVDAPLVPGLTFGWSPQKFHAIAYVDDDGHLAVMDYVKNGKQQVGGTKDVLLPAWSPDGTQIAFLERAGHKKYTLERVTVSLP